MSFDRIERGDGIVDPILIDGTDRIANNNDPVEGTWQQIRQRMGRTSTWLFTDDEQRTRGYKFKGASFLDHTGDRTGPSTRPYRRINPHLGFDPHGDFISALSRACPEGGITIDGARNEYRHALNNTTSGCPSTKPVALYKSANPEMRFQCDGQDSPLGVAVTELPEDAERIDELLAKVRDRKLNDDDKRKLETFGLSDSATVPEVLTALAGKTGETLRAFHLQAGSCRYSGYLNNLETTKENGGTVFLTDLDTSVRLNDFPEKIVALQMIRDLSSALYGIITWSLQKENIDHFKDDNCAWFKSLMKGYHQEIPEQVMEDLSGIFTRHFGEMHEYAKEQHANHVADTLGRETMDFQTYRQNTRTQYWVERNQVYMLAMSIMWVMNAHSELRQLQPLQFEGDHLLRNIGNFAKDPKLDARISSEFTPLFK